MRIPGRDGAIPEYRCTGRINGRHIEVVFAGSGEVIIPSQSLGNIEHADTTSKQYVVFRRREEHLIERNLRRRHGDLIWKRLPGDEGRGTFEVRAEFDARALCAIEMNRTVAKFGCNLIAEVFGRAAVESGFGELKRFIETGQYEDTLPAGIIWDEIILRHVPPVPPKHIFILFRDGMQHQVVILVFLFSLFPFCVVANNPEVRTDAFDSRTIDPYVGRFVPLLATRLLPEAHLAPTIAGLPRGGVEQAISAAKFAHKWTLDACERSSSSSGDHILCYECGRVLEPAITTCPYCGKDPLPAKAVGRD